MTIYHLTRFQLSCTKTNLLNTGGKIEQYHPPLTGVPRSALNIQINQLYSKFGVSTINKMIPDIQLLNKGSLTEYFTGLEDIINEDIAIPPGEEGKTFQTEKLHDLKIEAEFLLSRGMQKIG